LADGYLAAHDGPRKAWIAGPPMQCRDRVGET